MEREFGSRTKRIEQVRLEAQKTTAEYQARSKFLLQCIAASVGLVIGATAVGVYAFPYRMAVAFYPSALSNMKMPSDDNFRPVVMWDVTGTYDEVVPIVKWTTAELRRICGPVGFPKWDESAKGYAKADPDAPNRLMIGDGFQSLTAKEAVALINDHKDRYCGSFYHLAQFDARQGIWPLSLARMKEEQAILLAQSKAKIDRIMRDSRRSIQQYESSDNFRRLEPDMDIRRSCRDKWQHNYEMQEYCREQHREARSKVRRMHVSSDIATHCKLRWPENWEMYTYCVDNQTSAKSRLD